MATLTDLPPTAPPTPPSSSQETFKRNLALGLLIASPLLIALPPRKLDFYTILLGSSTFFSANHLLKHNTGRSFLNRAGITEEGEKVARPLPTREQVLALDVGGGGLPTERAREMQRLLREKRDVEGRGGTWSPAAAGMAGKQEEREESGILKKVWMGDEDADWKRKREAREKEVLENGEGVGTLIQEYFAEAMGFGKKEEAEERIERERERLEEQFRKRKGE